MHAPVRASPRPDLSPVPPCAPQMVIIGLLMGSIYLQLKPSIIDAQNWFGATFQLVGHCLLPGALCPAPWGCP